MYMKNDLVFTQIQKTVMTGDKTVKTVIEKLETVNALGRKRCLKSSYSEVEYHNNEFDIRRSA